MKIFYRFSVILFIAYISLITLRSQTLEKEGNELSLDSLLNIKVSTAAKYWQNVNEAPASVTIITASQIERYGYRTVDEVLRSVRGFYVSYDRNYSYVGVRGFSRPTDYNDRLLLLYDGHTLNENVYGGASIGNEFPIDLSSIDHIEIVRGPGSALYGTGAMFAVVNLIPRNGKDIDGISLSTDVGSYGRIGGSLIFGKEFNEDVNLLFSAYGADIDGDDLYFPDFDDPSMNNGIAEGLDWERFAGLHSSLRYKNISLRTMLTTRKKSVPTGAYGTLFNVSGFESIDERAFVELKAEFPFAADKNVFVRGYYDYYGYSGAYPYPAVINYDASIGSWAGGEAQFRWDIFSGNRFTVGGEWKDNPRADYRNWTPDTVYFDKNFPFHALSIYFQDEFQIVDNLALIAGIRRDEYSSTGSATTPRIALIYNPTNTSTVKLLYGDGFRAPNVYEANYEDALSQWKMNPDLRSEQIMTRELVYEQRISNSLFGVFSAYTYHMTDLIDSFKDSLDVSQFLNINEVNAFGLEVEVSFITEYGMKGVLSGSYQEAKDPSTNMSLSNSPAYFARFGLSYPLRSDVMISAECIYNSERITVYGTTTEPILTTRLALFAQPGLSDETWLAGAINRFKVSLLVDNIFNSEYSTPGGVEHLQRAIPQDRRNFRFKVSYAF